VGTGGVSSPPSPPERDTEQGSDRVGGGKKTLGRGKNGRKGRIKKGKVEYNDQESEGKVVRRSQANVNVGN